MIPLVVLLSCALVPQLVCRWARRRVLRQEHPDRVAQHRKRAPYRRQALGLTVFLLLAAWVAGCLAIGADFAPRWPGPAAIAFGGLCFALTFVSCALAHPYALGTPLPFWETVRRSIRWSLTFLAPVFVSYVVARVLLASPLAEYESGNLVLILASLAGVLSVLYVGAIVASVARAFEPAPLEAQRIADTLAAHKGRAPFRLFRLPTVERAALHVGALPWIRTLLLTDTVLERLGSEELEALIAYECYADRDPSWRRAMVWVIHLGLSAALFGTSLVLAVSAPQVLAACWGMAAFISTWLLWQANRHKARNRSALSFTRLHEVHPPSFANALRLLQPHHRHLLPVTSRQPLPPELYHRLLALGHDPGPPPS